MIETLIYAILTTLIIGVILYLFFNSNSKNSNSCYQTPKATHPLHIDYQESKSENLSSDKDIKKPEQLKEPRGSGKDNLQLIKGVGPVLEKVLNDTGVYHFEQIANWSDAEASWIDKSISFPGRIERENWRGQSKDLVKGKSTEFSERVEKAK